ncbi:MAG TPA: autoinducer binding domain-containing protein [Burkholderiaceae bacterium]|nr:autoinducer binding domain-containing protein [Burkholderiaceae bacterium]
MRSFSDTVATKDKAFPLRDALHCVPPLPPNAGNEAAMQAPLSLEDIAAVMDASSEDVLLELVRKSALALGFEQFMLRVEVSRPLVKPLLHVSSGYPLRWQRTCQEREYVWKDPTAGHCQLNTVPLVWSEQMYSEESRDLPEVSRSHGISHGLSVPVHERDGVRSMLSLARDHPIAEDPRELRHMLAGARVLASCTHFAITRIIVPALLEQCAPKLTRRERECLIWAAKGKTASEIGMILNFTEATSVFHLKNVVRKFDVANRTQAIAVGVALGLVS